MSEITISGAVGERPAANNAVDVIKLQMLLQVVDPPLQNKVDDTGQLDAPTLAAIREFQKRFLANPDGRIDPGGPSLQKLRAYARGTAEQRAAVSADVVAAKTWLGVVNRRLGHPRDADMLRKVKNIFHIAPDGGRYPDLRNRFVEVAKRFTQDFPRAYLPTTSLYGAWVLQGDSAGTMFFPSNYAETSQEERVTTLIHERAHTVFKIGHAGMSQEAGTADFGMNPDDDNGYTAEQSFGNAYCYGWLAQSLQPGYAPQAGGDVITGSPTGH
jgi:hypothetical protein